MQKNIHPQHPVTTSPSASIYIHIPFCKQVCYYCDFHFTVSFKRKDAVICAIEKEIALQKDYLKGYLADTIYFGGGTPSVLSPKEISGILNEIYNHYSIAPEPEITLEANPDDVTPEYLSHLRDMNINRLSIGIQSFNDRDLHLLNRRHNGSQAYQCIQDARQAGFNNVTIDLIYGIPGQSVDDWSDNLYKAISMDIPHLSCYHLGIEPKTVFAHHLKKGMIRPVDEATSIQHYEKLIEETKINGYIHYEISNFGKEGYFSRHNSGYWQQKHYLGIGPSAHSFNDTTRHWNTTVNEEYIAAIKQGKLANHTEKLNQQDKYNDYVMTALRTMWGVDTDYISRRFGNKYARHFLANVSLYKDQDYIKYKNGNYYLTDKGMLVSDNIIGKMIFV
jgi:oxygen-independent coproporphyrinogen-3 oxidase